MARRFSAPYQSEPFSRLASWARNLAIFSVVAVLVSVLIVRFGFLEMKPAIATFFGALGRAGLSGLSRLPVPEAAADPRHHHRPDRSAALRGTGAPALRRRRQYRRLCRPLFG